MPRDQKAPHAYRHGSSQLAAKDDYLKIPIERGLQQAAQAGRDWTRLVVKINIYEPPQVRGGSGRYVAWPHLAWKHDIKSTREALHFAKTVDRFVALYQQDPQAVATLLQAQNFQE